MTEEQKAAERRAIEHVISRLISTFAPGLGADDVARKVQEVYRRFEGSRIRDFVPLLVENCARRELAAAGRGPQPAPSM
ncbi:MAG: three-helix bundle dimerization domain-containing protein [Actinocrinis sp.]